MGANVRIPLINSFSCRDGNAGGFFPCKDAFIYNGLVEKDNSGEYITRRPGFTNLGVLGATAVNQGLFWFNGFVYSVNNDQLIRSSGSNFGGTDGTASSFVASTTPPWGARSNAPAVVFQDRIFIIGGSLAGNPAYADVTQSQDGINWSVNAGAAPFGARQGHGVVVFQGKLYLVGGQKLVSGSSVLQNDVWVSDDGANWTQLTIAAAFSPRAGFGCVAGNNGIYVLGGNTAPGTVVNDVWFSSDGITWTQAIANAPWTARSFGSYFYFQVTPTISGIFVVGGQNAANTPLNDSWFSTDGRTWVQKSANPFGTGRSQMGSCIYAGRMWLFGGIASGSATSSVWASADGITWSAVALSSNWSARTTPFAVAFRTPYTVSQYRYETLWVMGGNNNLVYNNEIWRGSLNVQINTTYNLNPDVFLQYYQFSTFVNGTKIVLKNQSNMWVLSGSVLTKVTDPNYPSVTVPGLVTLDSFVHVMTPIGDIHNCQLDDALTWPSINFITADYEDDQGVALAKYLNYVLAFGQWTMQFFYDAAQPEASELLPNISLNSRVGCAAPRTIIHMNNTIFWVGQTENGQRHVYVLEGGTPKPISTKYVDKWLMANDPTTISAIAHITGGHTVYVLLLDSNLNPSPVFEDGMWFQWSFQTVIPPLFTTTGFTANSNYMTASNVNNLYLIRGTDNDDDGFSITVGAQTNEFDNGNIMNKFWGRTTLIKSANSLANALTTIQTSDDDYTNYIVRGTVNDAIVRPFLTRQGASYKRSWFLTRNDPFPLRWQALEVQFEQGEG